MYLPLKKIFLVKGSIGLSGLQKVYVEKSIYFQVFHHTYLEKFFSHVEALGFSEMNLGVLDLLLRENKQK